MKSIKVNKDLHHRLKLNKELMQVKSLQEVINQWEKFYKRNVQ